MNAPGPRPTRGVAAAVGAFFLWGIFPIYWKAFDAVAPVDLVAHRVVWSLVFVLFVLPLRGRMGDFLRALRDPRSAGLYLASGLLLAVNWLTFVHAVATGRIIDSSLGYFLNPLFNILLGLLFLGERLRLVQWLAVGLAMLGVGVQILQLGRLPWISLVLAGTFALYGLLRKQGPLGPLTGFAVETAVLAPLGLLWLGMTTSAGDGAFAGATAWEWILLVSMGAVTAVPLLLFATAARALSLATLGLIQYLAPTGQLLVGVLVYGELFDRARALSFGFIWAGLVLYTIDGLRRHRGRAEAPAGG